MCVKGMIGIFFCNYKTTLGIWTHFWLGVIIANQMRWIQVTTNNKHYWGSPAGCYKICVKKFVKNRMRTRIWLSRISPTSKKLRKFMILSKLSNWHYVLQATIIYACSLWFYREHLSFKYYTCDSSLNWSTIRKCHVSKDEDAKRAVIFYILFYLVYIH